eukprot:jgi/Hompol1/1328/HPOL_005564-RA
MFEAIQTGFRATLFGSYGLFEFTKAGFERASKSFTPHALDVDLKGKTAIVTGANSGLGKETALALAQRGATVVMVCRNPQTGASVREELVAATKNSDIKLSVVDVSRPKEIKAFVDSFQKDNKHLDILINNAGVLLNERQETPDGIETTFATNTLGVFVMTKLLLPTLTATPGSRVINVSSGGMYNARLSTDDLESKSSYSGELAYAQTKRAEVELTTKWAHVHPSITWYSMHPGWSHTAGVEKSLPGFFSAMQSRLRSAAQGADTIVWAAISKEVVEHCPNGSFLFGKKRI